MKDYFIRRLLLVPFTLIGITLLVFAIVRLAPGGPVQQALSRLTGGENVSRSRAEAGFSLSPAQVLEIEEKFDRHKSIGRGYLEWLGVLPRDLLTKGKEFKADEKKLVMSIPDTVFEVQVIRDGDDVRFGKVEPEVQAELDDWRVRLLSPEFQARRWRKYSQGSALETPPPYRAVMFKPAHDGLLQGSLGYSSKYQDSVWSMILSRMPVSLYYGGISMVLIYAICLPLGVTKAVRHRTWLDNVSSVMVFTGYAIPGYALGALLIVFVAAKSNLFALGGFVGEGFEELSYGDKVKNLLHHSVLPLICYLIGSFAMMTMLMKNNLMDNLAADYVRTAIAKGVGFRRAVFRHAFRNSIIPIATTFGGNLTLIVGGSLLIERVFDINGFGLLSFSAVLEFDQPVIMGVLFVSATLMLIGNVISDLCVALVDPRVSYK